MRVTKEEVQSLLNRLVHQGRLLPDDLYDLTLETLARAVKSLPSREAVERDRQRGKKRQSADQTG